MPSCVYFILVIIVTCSFCMDENVTENVGADSDSSAPKTDQPEISKSKNIKRNSNSTNINRRNETVNTNSKNERIEGSKEFKFQDCCYLQHSRSSVKSGIYTIYPFMYNRSRSTKVYCDMETKGGGWTVIQRREPVEGPFTRFYRDFASYEEGFGSLKYSFWLGLESISALTMGYDQSIRFDFIDWEDERTYAEYARFYVADKDDLYMLDVENYSGDAGDSFSLHKGMYFTTQDVDNDDHNLTNCAVNDKGAWWYNDCGNSSLNGLFHFNGVQTPHHDGIIWWSLKKSFYYSLKQSEMKIRNINFKNGCHARFTNE